MKTEEANRGQEAEKTEVLRAGREMDALVAEKVMGWRICDSCASADEPGYYRNSDIPPYSTDISAAWLVVEKMRISMRFSIWSEDFWFARFTEDGEDHEEMNFLGHGETAPHAICLAALKAVDLK